MKKLSPKQQEWLSANNLIEPPNCKICDNIVKWQAGVGKYGIYCSMVCVRLDGQFLSNIRKLTNLEKYGHEHPQQNKQIRELTKQTNIEKYGVDNPRKSDKVKEKIKQTNLERYGVEYPSQNQEIKTKRIDTNLKLYGHINIAQGNIKHHITHLFIEKFGVDNPFKNKHIQEQIKQTNLERYGVEYPTQNQEIKTKRINTNLKNYGGHPKQQHMVGILPLIENYDWLIDQYINQNKTALYIAQELNISDVSIGKYLKKAEIEIKKYHQSFVSKLWLTQIQEQENIEIIYEYQWDKNNLRTKADGYCQETNTIYEFHGDYWHGNPEIYSPEEIHPIIKKTMGKLHKKTIEREERIKSLGYNLVVMWENDFR